MGAPRGGIGDGEDHFARCERGIAAYKAASICSTLVKQGHDVHVVMTEHATRFVGPLTFQALSRNPVLTDTFEEPNPHEIAHIAIADRADVFVVAPATANTIAKLAHGLADDMLSTMALAARCPVLVVPAMNVNMFAHPAVVDNVALLRRRGVYVMEPGTGLLACGWTGKGRLPEPEDVVAAIERLLEARQDLGGLRVVVTAGPTVEDLDPVRYLSNGSTGKMGYAIAEAARQRGASVCLISGPTALPPVAGAEFIRIRSTEDLLAAVQEQMPTADVLIGAAAPADFRPTERLAHKWKKSNGIPTLTLEPTPDVLATVARDKRPHQVFVGFAAETQDAVEQGRKNWNKRTWTSWW
ncbi:putative coenzyme A biosynthesis bifunctional protein CoaBC [Alicyclobacillus contaminans]|nr:putative coenzyme A biosynthesis bifunctional protein CoaBC [Alicyclobacillus contaminans]